MKYVLIALASLGAGLAHAADLSPLKLFELSQQRYIVTDAQDHTVYTFDVDAGAESRCYDSCANAWPPVLVESNIVVNAPVGLTTRRDGSTQLTLNGKPVYYYAGDAGPGDVNGDGLGGVWHIIVQ